MEKEVDRYNMAHVGIPSVRGMIRQYEQANYTPEKALYEMIDNVILQATQIHIQPQWTTQLNQLSVSDNVVEGFEHILKSGTSNPFNFTHMREGQDDDQETSQFGVGLKAGAISLGGRMDIYTLVKGQAYRVIFDFREMCRLDTFEPMLCTLPLEEYLQIHPFSTGSTLVLSQIREGTYKDADPVNHLSSRIQETYEELLRERPVQITVGQSPVLVRPNLYEHPLCQPFTQVWTILKTPLLYFIRKGNEYEVYDKCILKKKERPSLASLMEEAIECGTIQSTMIKFYHDKEGGELPYNSVHLYRNKRCYGNWDHTYSTKNGAKNYVQSRIDIRSKELAKRLGLTFNKSISDDIDNAETQAFKSFVRHVTKGFNTDTNAPAYVKLEKVAIDAGILAPVERTPMTRVKYFRGKVPTESRVLMASYIQEHPAISEEKEFKTFLNHMIRKGWIPSPE